VPDIISEYISLFLCAVIHVMARNKVTHEKCYAVNHCSCMLNVRPVGHLTPLCHLEMLIRGRMRDENERKLRNRILVCNQIFQTSFHEFVRKVWERPRQCPVQPMINRDSNLAHLWKQSCKTSVSCSLDIPSSVYSLVFHCKSEHVAWYIWSRYSPPTSVEIKKTWNYTSTAQYVFRA
jgi:hypothetical protein